MTFKKYIKRYREYFTLEGDFVRDVLSDKYFPRYSKRKHPSLVSYHSDITQYLYEEGADYLALTAFESLWKEYMNSSAS